MAGNTAVVVEFDEALDKDDAQLGKGCQIEPGTNPHRPATRGVGPDVRRGIGRRGGSGHRHG